MDYFHKRKWSFLLSNNKGIIKLITYIIVIGCEVKGNGTAKFMC